MSSWGLHLTIGSSNDDYSTIHRSSTSNHVLDIISVSRAVDVRVMTVIGFIFNVSSRDSNTTSPFFWGLINRGVVVKTGLPFRSEDLGDSSSQSSLLRSFISTCSLYFPEMKQIAGQLTTNLSVINMPDGTWVNVSYLNSMSSRNGCRPMLT